MGLPSAFGLLMFYQLEMTWEVAHLFGSVAVFFVAVLSGMEGSCMLVWFEVHGSCLFVGASI